MNKETIIRLAREAGLEILNLDGEDEVGCGDGYHIQTDLIERFAALVAAHERERCAKVCDNLSIDHGMFHPDDEMFKEGILGGARMCAVTIRSRI